MNGYLLDTNVALLAMSRSVLESMKGALKVGDPRTWWLDALEHLAARPLALWPEHVTAVHTLPPIHKDPFDRVLIAQATVEDLTLLNDGRRNSAVCLRAMAGGLMTAEKGAQRIRLKIQISV